LKNIIIVMFVVLTSIMNNDMNVENVFVEESINNIKLYREDDFQTFDINNFDEQIIKDYGSEGYGIPSEFVQYCVKALIEEDIINRLNDISLSREILNISDKVMILFKKGTLPYIGMLNDVWYYMDLSTENQKGGKDIVVYHEESGSKVFYFFNNICGNGKSFELMGKGIGKGDTVPYSVKWDEQIFSILLYKRREDNRVVGMTIYNCIGTCSVLTIGIQEESKVNISYQGYVDIRNADSNSTEYPKVYWSD